MISFPCPSCRKTLKAPEEKAGARTNCPHCRSPVQVPAAPPQVSQPPAALTANCPGCGRAIPVYAHELANTFECAVCKTCFTLQGQQAGTSIAAMRDGAASSSGAARIQPLRPTDSGTARKLSPAGKVALAVAVSGFFLAVVAVLGIGSVLALRYAFNRNSSVTQAKPDTVAEAPKKDNDATGPKRDTEQPPTRPGGRPVRVEVEDQPNKKEPENKPGGSKTDDPIPSVDLEKLYNEYQNSIVTADTKYLNKRVQLTPPHIPGVASDPSIDKSTDSRYYAWWTMFYYGKNKEVLCYFRADQTANLAKVQSGQLRVVAIRGICAGRTGTVKEHIPGYDPYTKSATVGIDETYPVVTFNECELVIDTTSDKKTDAPAPPANKPDRRPDDFTKRLDVEIAFLKRRQEIDNIVNPIRNKEENEAIGKEYKPIFDSFRDKTKPQQGVVEIVGFHQGLDHEWVVDNRISGVNKKVLKVKQEEIVAVLVKVESNGHAMFFWAKAASAKDPILSKLDPGQYVSVKGFFNSERLFFDRDPTPRGFGADFISSEMCYLVDCTYSPVK